MKSSKLDKLSHGQDIILCFDCEFWHLFDKENVNYIAERNYFFIPREIGGFIYTKNSKGEWKLNKPFFVSLNHVSEDISLPISQFASVNIETAAKLDQIKDEIGMNWVDAHFSILDNEKQKLLKKAIKIYENDPYIKKHHKSHSWIKDFLELFPKSTIVIKGLEDIKAIENLCILKGYEYKEPKKIVDIARWNKKFKKYCGSAKLEQTFLCIKENLDSEISEILDHLPKGNAHNPLMDSTMTLIIALFTLKSFKL